MNTPRICIIDYGMGNLGSVQAALRFLGNEAKISDRVEDMRSADALVLPGVGAFAEAMANLRRLGLDKVLNKEVMAKGKPFLGICLGMQLIGRGSEEMGHTEGLQWISADVIPLADMGVGRVPHVGWSETTYAEGEPLFRKIEEGTCFYYDHSFAMLTVEADSVATCAYGTPFVAALRHGNIMATQFHPEKSQRAGLKLLRNFLDLAAGHSTGPADAGDTEAECRRNA
jgi:imidazole glycerol-phosphate synthase subunit HisH